MKESQNVTLPTLMTLIEVLGAFVIIAFFSYWPFTLGFCFLSYFLPPYLPSLFYLQRLYDSWCILNVMNLKYFLTTFSAKKIVQS